MNFDVTWCFILKLQIIWDFFLGYNKSVLYWSSYSFTRVHYIISRNDTEFEFHRLVSVLFKILSKFKSWPMRKNRERERGKSTGVLLSYMFIYKEGDISWMHFSLRGKKCKENYWILWSYGKAEKRHEEAFIEWKLKDFVNSFII